MTLITSMAERVRSHTPSAVNRRIADETAARLERIGDEPAAIRRRLAELDQEWDIERAIEFNASSLMVVGTLLGLRVNPRFLVLPLAVSAFLLQHAIQGWCPPLPVLRRLGFRDRGEIESERNALLKRLETPIPPVRGRNSSLPFRTAVRRARK